MATTPFASMNSLGRKPSPRHGPARAGLALGLFLALVALAVVACGTARAADPTVRRRQIAPRHRRRSRLPRRVSAASPSPSATPRARAAGGGQARGGPAEPAGLPVHARSSRALFLLLAGLYALTGNVVVAIILMTLLIRLLTIRLSARQIVSQKRMQMLAPELRELTKELQRRYKGDRQAIYAGHPGVLQGARRQPHGRLPAVAPPDGTARSRCTGSSATASPTSTRAPCSRVFGINVVPSLTCPNPAHIVNGVVDKAQPCINTVVAGINMGQPQVLFDLPLVGFTLGVSALALVSAFAAVRPEPDAHAARGRERSLGQQPAAHDGHVPASSRSCTAASSRPGCSCTGSRPRSSRSSSSS